MLWRLLLPSILLVVVPVWAVVCPGGKVKCPETMTCCALANHEFGCCTYPEAQCCHDHVHCCPHGMKCDERHQACLNNGFPTLFFAQISVRPQLVEEVNPTDSYQIHSLETNHIDGIEADGNTCPDGHECPNSFTCCQMYRGRYGCCPYNNAKCCKDGFHCCPHGSQCDPITGGCENGGNWLGKAAPLMNAQQPTKPSPLEVADPGGKCPDGHPCLEKFTCCKVQDGGYGCCPYTDAICCTDLIHCCPKNTNCNTSTGTCDVERSFSVPAFSLATLKLADVPPLSGTSSASVSEARDDDPNGICPDRRSRCRPGSTCCQTVSGSYGCCPMPQATCCSDHKSCCPNGYQCAAGGMCERVDSVAAHPFLPPIIVQETEPAPSESSPTVEDKYVHCPDGSMCPDENTCCRVSSGFGCCPMPQATCCGDMKHCCPHGYWCADQGCERLEGTILNKTLIVHHLLKVDSPRVMLAP